MLECGCALGMSATYGEQLQKVGTVERETITTELENQ